MSSKILGSEVSGTSRLPPRRCCGAWLLSVNDPRRNSHGDAEREAARKLDQARREAYAEGLAAGRQQAEDQFRPAVQGLADTLNTLARLRESIREETIQDLVHLATSIAGARDSSRSGRGSGCAGGVDPGCVYEIAIARDQPRAHASDAGSRWFASCWSRRARRKIWC